MNTMSNSIYTPKFAEAATIDSVPCRQALVVDDRRFGLALTLAERCAR